MAVDDTVVKGHIDEYLGRYSTLPPLQRNGLAFRDIIDFLNAGGDSADESLAAAEHYLFAKYMVSNIVVSEHQMIVMVLGYDGIKAIAQTNSYTERAMRHNPDRPTSKVSASSIVWGLKGAKDGESDHQSFAPYATVPNWNWDAMKFGGITDNMVEYAKRIY